MLLLQTLGNYEFDHGISTLLPHLNGIQDIPTVVSNLNMTAESELNNFLFSSLAFTTNNTKVGIVGCLTTDTPVIILYLYTSISERNMHISCSRRINVTISYLEIYATPVTLSW